MFSCLFIIFLVARLLYTHKHTHTQRSSAGERCCAAPPQHNFFISTYYYDYEAHSTLSSTFFFSSGRNLLSFFSRVLSCLARLENEHIFIVSWQREHYKHSQIIFTRQRMSGEAGELNVSMPAKGNMMD